MRIIRTTAVVSAALLLGGLVGTTFAADSVTPSCDTVENAAMCDGIHVVDGTDSPSGATTAQVWANIATATGVPAASIAVANGTTTGTKPAVGRHLLVPRPTVPPTTTTVGPTTTTVPPTTTTTVPPTTTSTTVPPTTTTTIPTTTTTTVAPASGCGLVSPVFCATFDSPAGNGGRSGDLDPQLWGVSRLGRDNGGGGELNTVAATTVAGCGNDTAQVMEPADVRVCGGRLTNGLNDAGAVVGTAMYPKQPFDFTGRTGKVTFDVTDDTEGTHAAWPEFWITAKPYPANMGEISFQVPSIGQDSIGFSLAGGCAGSNTIGVDKVDLSQNYLFSEPAFSATGCVTKSAGVGQAMNHVEVDVSTSQMVVYGTNPGSSALVQLAVVPLNLDFSKGLVWLTDVHYNAKKAIEPCECGDQVQHTFQWDNLGFDGPATYRDLSFDVPDAHAPHAQLCDTNGVGVTTCSNAENEGWQVTGNPLTLSTNPVFRLQTPTAALVTFNSYSWDPVLPSVSLNGGAFIANPWPYLDSPPFQNGNTGFAVRSYAMVVPLDQVHDGTNTLTFKTAGGSAWVANINLILVAAAPVP